MNKLQRIILTKTPIGFIANKSKHWHPPGFEGLALYDVMVFLYRQLRTQGFTERAAAISYHFIMAIPPSFLFLFTLIPNLPFISKKAIKFQLHTLILDMIPAKGYNRTIIDFVDSFLDGNKIGLISLGLLLSLFFASNAMMGLSRSFNKNYIGFEKRKGLKKRWVAIRITVLIFGLLLGYLILLIMQGAILKMMVQNNTMRQVIFYSRWILIILLILCAIGFIFRYIPSLQKRWKFISPGVILTTTLSIFASLGFSAFVNNFGRYNALYGSIGTIMMVMALIFINSLALIIGFELNVSIRSLKAHAHEREENERKNIIQGKF